ncbi:hypothetical protein [Kineococcus aurantiacus]|uniref:Uncharacterized protein n=1 Tax=Kineococcus aurantiacus TaxID=37633 RepID=A0A7Y9DQE2_9ACTN|nr:hypothetical protein [Kineococcus aurantiacus]NYD24897.1 hypothetical protein [Kineococcus aurantiacus]
MDFFPDPPQPAQRDELDEPARPAWSGPPDDVLAGVVPVELVLGRSDSTVLTLSGLRAFPTGLGMVLGVRVRGPLGRRDLNSEVFDGPYEHVQDAAWQRGRLKWGFELADGQRVTNLDPGPWGEQPTGPDGAPDDTWQPSRPLLTGGGGDASRRSANRDHWLWPLPPAGRLRVVCQWLEQGIELTSHELDADLLRQAAERARPLWP